MTPDAHGVTRSATVRNGHGTVLFFLIFDHLGSPGTSVVNLTCTTNTVANGSAAFGPYHVSLHCTWLFGEEAPEDTQYFFYYRSVPVSPRCERLVPSRRKSSRVFLCRYGARMEECRQYSRDPQRRSSACWFPSTLIEVRGHDWLAVRVSGSSQHAAIRPLDRLFALHAIGKTDSEPGVGRGAKTTWADHVPDAGRPLAPPTPHG